MHIPIAYGVIDKDSGKELVPTAVYHLKGALGSISVDDPVDSNPVASLMRGFSAPIKLHGDAFWSDSDLAALAAFDTDIVAAWDAFNGLATRAVHEAYRHGGEVPGASDEEGKGGSPSTFSVLQECFLKVLLTDEKTSMEKAQTLALPSANALVFSFGDEKTRVDPQVGLLWSSMGLSGFHIGLGFAA